MLFDFSLSMYYNKSSLFLRGARHDKVIRFSKQLISPQIGGLGEL